MRRPSATRGVGRRCARTTASTSGAGRAAGPRSRTASPAAAAPSVPVARIASPGRAPLRPRGAPSTTPTRVTDRTMPWGPAHVSPPTRATPCCRAMSRIPWNSSSTSATSSVGGSASAEKRIARLASHRCDVRDVDRDRLGADVAERSRGPAKVDALEQHVGRQEERRRAAAHRGSVVADPHQDLGARRRKAPAEPADQPPLAERRQRRGGDPRRVGVLATHRRAPLRRPRPSAS